MQRVRQSKELRRVRKKKRALSQSGDRARVAGASMSADTRWKEETSSAQLEKRAGSGKREIALQQDDITVRSVPDDLQHKRLEKSKGKSITTYSKGHEGLIGLLRGGVL